MSTDLTRGTSDPAQTASQTVWATRREGGAGLIPWRLPAGLFFGPTGHVSRAFGRAARLMTAYWLRRSLRTLTDAQLRDAGIDSARAGRGRAADVNLDPNLGSGR